MRIPPGVTPQDFESAVVQWREAIGAEWVYTSDADADLYRDAYTPFRNEEGEIIPAAAVAPDTVEQVQAILRIANRYRIPIYPVSTGRNLGYGGTAPVLSGSVVLDLKRMNRILEVNERNAYALVEPGVSYFDLYRYIQDQGYKLWIDVPAPGWGSLIGNALDHGAGYTANPHRDHFDCHCGMEVVLANGDLVRTGMGALPGARTWQQFKYGYGPTVDGLFAQSNFGVVTKMGFWLYPEPEAYFDATVSVPRFNDVIPLVDILAHLIYSGVLNSNTIMGSPMRYGTLDQPEINALFLNTDQPEAVRQLDQYAAANRLAFWDNRLKFYGPEAVIKAQWEYAKKKFAAIPDVSFQDGKWLRFPLAREQIDQLRDKENIGVPSLEAFRDGARSPTNPTPNIGHLGFSPVIPMTGEAVIESQRVIARALVDLDATPAFNTLPNSYHTRDFIILIGFSILDDVDVNKKSREVFRRLITIAAEHGWGEYRTHTAFMDDVADVYSFNNHALRRLHETLKDAVDPAGILSAGRYGIWPKHLRKT
jgi:4-cresol dehydrogenase (hydroxylating)